MLVRQASPCRVYEHAASPARVMTKASAQVLPKASANSPVYSAASDVPGVGKLPYGQPRTIRAATLKEPNADIAKIT